MCLSLTKLAYQLKLQFEKTQIAIENHFRKSDLVKTKSEFGNDAIKSEIYTEDSCFDDKQDINEDNCKIENNTSEVFIELPPKRNSETDVQEPLKEDNMDGQIQELGEHFTFII